MKKKNCMCISKSLRRMSFFVAVALTSSCFAIHGDLASATTHNLVGYPKNKMTRLSLKKVLSAKRPEGAGSLQGFAMTDKYYVLIMRPSGLEDNNQVLIIRRDDNKNVTASFGNPVYNMGHGNDATWNRKTDEIIVVDGSRKELARLDANNFKKKGIAKLYDANGKTLIGSGIAYDKNRNVYHTSLGRTIRSFNSKNQLVFGFQELHNQVNQGLAYNNGYLYRPTWESAGGYPGAKYDGIFKKHTTVLYQFGIDGSFTRAYYIDNPLYEVESMDFDEKNTPFIAFNGPTGYYSIYKIVDPNQLKQLHQSYTISYFDNGGSGSPAEQTAYVGTEKNLSKVKPSRTNYTFLGWSTNKEATRASYSAGAKYFKAYGSSNTNVKLYAVWQLSSYTISYNANGGSGAPSHQQLPFNQDATLSKVKPTRANYTFLGWSANKAATAAGYRPGAIYKGRKTITLYAVWRSKTYSIIYNANGGTGAPSVQTATAGRVTNLSKVKPTRANHTFLGWSNNKNAATAQYAPGADFVRKTNVTLYAVWKITQSPMLTPTPTPIAQTLTITFDANGGINAPNSITGEVGKITLPAAKPTRAGFVFLGWNEDKNASSANRQPSTKYLGATSATLYAVWRQQIIVIAFDANGGKNAPATQNVAINQTIKLPTDVPIRDGYVFLGWGTDKDAKNAEYEPGSQLSSHSDMYLYAIWEHKMYTISFDANSGINAPLPISTDTDEIVLPPDRPTRSGYTFLGWSTSSDSSKVEYQPGDIINGLENLKLYAIWQPIMPMPIIDTADDSVNETISDKVDGNNDKDTSEINGGEDNNFATVTLDEPDELPTTGPVEIASAVIAFVCVTCGVVYWAISSNQLKKLYRSIRGRR